MKSGTKTPAGLMWTGVLFFLLVTPGCDKDNQKYCHNDTECQDPSATERYSPATPECHGEGHFCYEGCSSDADCKDTSKSWHQADKLTCNTATKDCVSALADGGVDTKGNDGGAANGTKCSA